MRWLAWRSRLLVRGVLARGGEADKAAPAAGDKAAADLRPRWINRDASAAKPVWTEWRNALAPAGLDTVAAIPTEGYAVLIDGDRLLLTGAVYAESVQLFMAMRDSPEPLDRDRYRAVTAELADLCERLEIRNVDFYDGTKTIEQVADWLAAGITRRKSRSLAGGEFSDENWCQPPSMGT